MSSLSEKCPPPDIIGTNLLTKFHEHQTINVASRMKNVPPLTNCLTKFHDDRTINVASEGVTRKNAPPPGGNVFHLTGTIFNVIQFIIGMNLLTMFHWALKLGTKYIIGTNLLTEFHEDRTKNVASRGLTRKKVPPPWETYFIGTDVLTKCHEDRTINVATRVVTMQMLTPYNARRMPHDAYDGQKAITKANHEHIVLR
ncbi:hypothetical protein DPMN_014543 [Dreissena polymorpha]|uniref:Uncharacterized protein n=1 Tax=Dreissena polymorpha TaxID=45954 RepID=A0A9D4S5B7_DREPO|nr:hypothetical protein DPMN_014543 [Dreissena polymorpha]